MNEGDETERAMRMMCVSRECGYGRGFMLGS